MAFTPVKIYQGQPTNAETTLLSAITGNRIIKQIIVTNTSTTVSSSLSLSLVPAAGSAVAANRIVSTVPFAPNSVTTLDLSQVMTNGDFISGIQTVSGAITLTISGVSF